MPGGGGALLASRGAVSALGGSVTTPATFAMPRIAAATGDGAGAGAGACPAEFGWYRR
jgi:hypothetical protein